MQAVDYTTLVALVAELRQDWVPAKLEQVYQYDKQTICLALRTLKKRDWLWISWHPQAARIHMGDRPPRDPDTFTFSEQLRHLIKGSALIGLEFIQPWERVVDLQFGTRPGDPAKFHLYVEIMGKHSNVILTDADQKIITTAQQITSDRSSVRPVETGQPYQVPPALTKTAPRLDESFERWQERVALLPKALKKQLLSNYRGVSPLLLENMIQAADLASAQNTNEVTSEQWQALFTQWQNWLHCLEKEDFSPIQFDGGYSVLNWPNSEGKATDNLQGVVSQYYGDRLNEQQFQQLRHQLQQKLNTILKKLRQKAKTFGDRLAQSQGAETFRQYGDLMMSFLHEWQVGMTEITLTDFETGEPIKIPLKPDKNAVQNGQAFYKQHQKLKRANQIVQPLLDEVNAEIHYLEQIEGSLEQLTEYKNRDDLKALQEIKTELIQEKYLASDRSNPSVKDISKPHIYPTPSGGELWIGRNNQQNDNLTFRMANDYDIWFHSQEIPGSHVLLRLQPGEVPDEKELQWAADFAAYYSRASQSEQVPIIYTKPKNVYKPKGAKPGMCIYKRETILWGQPQRAKQAIASQTNNQD
ncbi:NFACT family protein [[Leptolyngbya] sp. PCC 7376]|uniref:Rqc2 family fibronectin-binding protein n=1 Tax=[Leptolyngbya] sp. PCC 7376 TaxID=111781 RepID=UPI0005A1878E|nr:NFACT RNA binding domain-containing protein [[Leptolyngbya] sp. PCC 7376]